MKKFILLILSIILISFLGVVVWMNLTPGYFQYGSCGCTVEYVMDQQSSTCTLNGVCEPAAVRRFIDHFLLILVKLDFNKGSRSGGVDGAPPISAPEDRSGAEGKFCGGFAANLPENQCPAGYHCQLEDNRPDAGGVCVK